MSKSERDGRRNRFDEDEFDRQVKKANRLKRRELTEDDEDESFEDQIKSYMLPNRKK